MNSIAKPAALAATLAAALACAAATEKEGIEGLLNARAGESPRAYEAAARIVAENASEGKPLSQFILALVSTEPDAPAPAKLPDDVRKRYLSLNRRLIQQLATQKDNPLAWYLLYIDGGDARLLKKSADGDNVQALNEFGVSQLATVEKRSLADEHAQKVRRECFGAFSRAAMKNDPNGLYNVGVCHFNGWGARKDASLAIENLAKAAERGQPKAMNLLGRIYLEGDGADRDPVAAAKYFSRSASLGNAAGELAYAKALDAGTGIEQNRVRAAALYKSAAGQGLVEAMDLYAKSLYSPPCEGVEPVPPEATPEMLHDAVSIWRHCAVEKKYAPSMDNLATAFLEGKGVEKNPRAAVKWFKAAADLGHTPAMLHMAQCCEDGIGGLKKSHFNANWWKTMAAAAEGDRNAAVWLGEHGLE